MLLDDLFRVILRKREGVLGWIRVFGRHDGQVGTVGLGKFGAGFLNVEHDYLFYSVGFGYC